MMGEHLFPLVPSSWSSPSRHHLWGQLEPGAFPTCVYVISFPQWLVSHPDHGSTCDLTGISVVDGLAGGGGVGEFWQGLHPWWGPAGAVQSYPHIHGTIPPHPSLPNTPQSCCLVPFNITHSILFSIPSHHHLADHPPGTWESLPCSWSLLLHCMPSLRPEWVS